MRRYCCCSTGQPAMRWAEGLEAVAAQAGSPPGGGLRSWGGTAAQAGQQPMRVVSRPPWRARRRRQRCGSEATGARRRLSTSAGRRPGGCCLTPPQQPVASRRTLLGEQQPLLLLVNSQRSPRQRALPPARTAQHAARGRPCIWRDLVCVTVCPVRCWLRTPPGGLPVPSSFCCITTPSLL